LRLYWLAAETRRVLNRTGIQLALCLAAAMTPGLAQCRFPADGAGRILTYTFDPTVTATSTVLHVTLRFRGGADAEEEIDVPFEWAGETLHGVINLHALSEETVVADNTSRGSKIIRHLPNQEVVLAYDIVKDWTGRFNHPAQFHGAILPEYIEINGANSLIHPKLPVQTQVTAHFDWKKLPAAWVLATSFGTGSNSDERCQSYSGPWSDVEEALFAAGEFRIHRFQIGVRPAVLAIRGEWTFSDEELVAGIQRAVDVVRGFWRDDNFPYFLVTLKPFDNDSGSGDGSQFTNAFWLYLSRRDQISDFLPTLVHEAFHAWNPHRMGLSASADSSALEWFSEGVTFYYGYLLAYRAGLIQLPGYVENINGDLLHSSDSSNAHVRGRLIALWLDQQIRKDSGGKGSLDNVMYDMVSAAAKPLTRARILETAGSYLSPASRAELARIVEPGSALPAAEDALGPCVRGSAEETAPFHLGFDLAASTAAGIVTGVEAGGPAFQAGLRNGQRLSGRLSVYNNQPDKMAIVTIETGDTRQAIEYYPRGTAVMLVQYHLDREAYDSNPANGRPR
jgi:predicted metalloprotease with PDZ domain